MNLDHEDWVDDWELDSHQSDGDLNNEWQVRVTVEGPRWCVRGKVSTHRKTKSGQGDEA